MEAFIIAIIVLIIVISFAVYQMNKEEAVCDNICKGSIDSEVIKTSKIGTDFICRCYYSDHVETKEVSDE